jgi:hypothetical protein
MKKWPVSDVGFGSSLRWFVGIVAALVALASVGGRADEQVVRWDIISLSSGVVTAGGIASAKATNAGGTETSTITMTGSGTFEVPEKDEEGDDVTGGGTWTITTGAITTSGSYKVTGVVRWTEAPGAAGFTDNIANGADKRAGLAVLRIKYSPDGELGTLVVSCTLGGTPPTVFEGITATKGFAGYWKAQPPTPSLNANRTLFHVMNEED